MDISAFGKHLVTIPDSRKVVEEVQLFIYAGGYLKGYICPGNWAASSEKKKAEIIATVLLNICLET